MATTVFINEIHYSSLGLDVGQGIEIVAPAGTNLDGWSILLYNSDGTWYSSTGLNGTIADIDGTGYGTRTISFSNTEDAFKQEAGGNGIALVNNLGQVIQFLSYGGTITATNGSAVGTTSTNIGVLETDSTPVGSSLQLTGTGVVYEDFTWVVSSDDNFGAFNNGQVFAEPTPGITITQSEGSTVVNEAGATVDTYTIALDSRPSGEVQIRIAADGQTQVSLDGVTFSDSLILTTDSKDPQTIYVKAVDDSQIEDSIHLGNITHNVISSVDPDYQSLSIPNVVVSITDNDINQAPIAQDDTSDTVKNAPVAIPFTDLLANDSDADGTFELDSVGNPTNGTVTRVGNTVVFTPTSGFAGEASFTYTIKDDQGATDTATVTITVANISPLATDDTATTLEGTAITLLADDLLDNDQSPDGDPLNLQSVGDAVGGTVTLDANGNVIFTPNAGFTGDASFNYILSDGTATDTGTVTVTVTPQPNTPPAAGDDSDSTKAGTPLTIAIADLLSNDSDDDGDTLTLTGVGDAVGGTVAIVDDTVVFTPDEGFTGDASFTYTITDGTDSDTATVNITVTEVVEVNTPPVAGDDSDSTEAGTPLTIAIADLLSNDNDDDGDTLTLTGVDDAVGGTVTIVDDTVVFTPDEGFTGDASFTYTITDGTDNDTATVSITVTEATTEEPDGLGGQSTFTVGRGNSLVIHNFGGVACGSAPLNDVIGETDTLKFEGEGLTARNMILTQVGSDLLITFEGVEDTQVTLKDFALENLDNLQRSTGATVDLGNIIFDGQTDVSDSFDVFDANLVQNYLWNRDTVTFLNDLDNEISRFDNSDDVVNAQGGDDAIYTLSGDDLIRSGSGDDLLQGGEGDDLLRGGVGADDFVFAASDLNGSYKDVVLDFNAAEGDQIVFWGAQARDLQLANTSDGLELSISGLEGKVTIAGLTTDTWQSNYAVFG